MRRLPLEHFVYLFSFLTLEETVRLTEVSRHFQDIVTTYLQVHIGRKTPDQHQLQDSLKFYLKNSHFRRPMPYVLYRYLKPALAIRKLQRDPRLLFQPISDITKALEKNAIMSTEDEQLFEWFVHTHNTYPPVQINNKSMKRKLHYLSMLCKQKQEVWITNRMYAKYMQHEKTREWILVVSKNVTVKIKIPCKSPRRGSPDTVQDYSTNKPKRLRHTRLSKQVSKLIGVFNIEQNTFYETPLWNNDNKMSNFKSLQRLECEDMVAQMTRCPICKVSWSGMQSFTQACEMCDQRSVVCYGT
ncbi:MAG: hypothetical protein ACTSUE_09045 [Promethearchaeota archaeon]